MISPNCIAGSTVRVDVVFWNEEFRLLSIETTVYDPTSAEDWNDQSQAYPRSAAELQLSCSAAGEPCKSFSACCLGNCYLDDGSLASMGQIGHCM